MKKTIVGILSFVFLFIGAQGVYASGPFNGQSGDCNPGIGIGVYPGNIQKDGYGCWSNTSVTANAGDTINVAMYYHNNTGDTLTNVSGSIVKSSSGPSTSYTFTGRMYSDQGSTTVGTVTLNLTSSQTLTYSSTHWMKDANAIMSDTDTSTFNNDGGQISIGSVPAGWSDYGEFLAVFKVSNTVAPQVCQDSNANNYLISYPCTYTQVATTYTIIASAGTGGTISPSGVTSYPLNDSKWFTITPSAGYHALDVLVDGASVGPNYGGYAFYYINRNHTISATFEKDAVITPPVATTYTIIASAGTGGTISPSGVTSYPLNDSKWFTITPSTGYHALDVLVDGASVGPNYGGYAFYYINRNHTISATFEKDAVITQKSCVATLSTNKPSIVSGESATLSWTLADCTEANIYPTIGNVYSSNSQIVYPTSSMMYTLTAKGANGTVVKTVTINVDQPVVSTYTITAIAGTGGTISPSGATSYNKNDSKFYTVTANSGYITSEILVDGVSQPLVGGYAFYYISANHTIRANFTQTQAPKTCSATIYTNKPSITKGESATLSWTLADCIRAEIYPIVGTVYSSNSQMVYPTSSTMYTLVATGTTGNITRTVTITVSDPVVTCQDSNATNYRSAGTCVYPPQLCKDPAASNYNQVIPCTYPPQLCKDTSATNYNGALPCQYPAAQRYCQDSNASNYLGLLPCEYPVRLCMDYGASNYRGALPCTYPTPLCKDVNASNYNGALPCYYQATRIVCRDSSASNYLETGSCIYNNYNTTRCTDASATNYLSYSSCTYNNNQVRCLDSAANNYLAYNYCTYNTQVRCLDSSASNYLAYNSCLYNVVLNKNVVTTVATNITANGAQINGYITNSTFYNSNVYFNYGTTINLGSRTNSKTTSGNSYFNDFITGLTPNTIYFFQAVGENSTGVSKGNIEVFKTLTDGTIRPIIIQGTTVIGTNSPVELTITNKYELIGQGDLIDYIVTYKNISRGRLSRPMVQVVLPVNVTLVNASRGTYSVDNHTLSAPLADLLGGEEGVIYLQGRVDSIPLNNAQIATTAILVYTNSNNAQENAMAYVLNQPKFVNGIVTEGSVLGASAFFAGLMSIGLIGWLLILLLILIIILIAKSYSRNNTNTDSKTIIHTTTH